MDQKIEKRENGHSNSHAGLWKLVGATALVLALASVIVNLPDIKRYIKISTM